MPFNLLAALSAVDMNKYICSKDIRPSKNMFYLFYLINLIWKIKNLTVRQLLCILAQNFVLEVHISSL